MQTLAEQIHSLILYRYAAMTQRFQAKCYHHWNSLNIFLLTLLGKVLFPWWSSPQPYILS